MNPPPVNLSGGITFAQFVGGGKTGIIGIINTALVPTIFALAFLTFLWGIFQYFILGAGDEKKRTEGRSFALWGLLGMVVLFSIWGFVNLLLSTLGISPSSA